MKNYKLTAGAFLFALSFIATGCNNEDLVSDDNSNSAVISVNSIISGVDGESRAVLGSDGKTPVWESNDEIAVKVGDASAVTLKLTSGVGTSAGKFAGTITGTGSMSFYYPASAAEKIDLASQDGDTKKMVMFGKCDYSTTPSIHFQNKTSILKFNMDVPDGSGWTSSSNLRAIVCGVYTGASFDADGNLIPNTLGSINVSKVSVSADKKITGYAVVIPGSAVKNLSIIVTDGTNEYKTEAYTSDKTIPENSVVAIKRALVGTSLVEKSGIYIGMQKSLKKYGPYINGITGDIYTMSEGAEKNDCIDMAMFYSGNSTTKGPAICSASADNMSFIYGVENSVTAMGGDADDVWGNWSKRKSTVMKKLTMTSEEFSAINTNSAIIDLYNNSEVKEVNVIFQLAAKDVIAYKTEEGVYGLVYVNGDKIPTSNQSHIGVDMKIIKN